MIKKLTFTKQPVVLPAVSGFAEAGGDTQVGPAYLVVVGLNRQCHVISK
jgi:hypothetical protein